MCGVRADRGTTRLLSGLPDRFQLREWTDKWVADATKLVTDAAPWRWCDAVATGGRPRRIGNLGGFNPSRRPGLLIECRDGAAFLTFDQSSSPLVAPRVTWERDIDYDLVRLGLVTREQIPMPFNQRSRYRQAPGARGPLCSLGSGGAGAQPVR